MTCALVVAMKEEWSSVAQGLAARRAAIARYQVTQDRLLKTDVSKDPEYRRVYNAFYRMRQRPKRWYDFYFSFLETHKSNKALTFANVLGELSRYSGQLEASFSSKLVATVRPDMPVFDAEVGKKLQLSTPGRRLSLSARVGSFVATYRSLTDFMNSMLQCPEFSDLRKQFDQAFPEFRQFTDMKKLDLMLWATPGLSVRKQAASSTRVEERMLSWQEFAAAAPEIAARGRALLGIGYAFLGTTAADGGPRIHPATPLINGGRLFVFVGKHTVKYRNLMRDGRYAMHAVLGESDEEFLLHGRAVPADAPDSEALAWEAARAIGMTNSNHRLMEFMIEYAHWAVWEGLGMADIRRVAKTWRAAG